MKVFTEHKGKPIKAWVDGVLLEEAAKSQLENIASLPFIYKHVAVMPDCHLGIGATVGSVIATQNAIIPASVGVDLGCGMSAVKLNLTASQLPDNLGNMRSIIEQFVPHGRTDHGGVNDKGQWQKGIPLSVQRKWKSLEFGYGQIVSKHPKIEHSRTLGQLGTLGTGNHFIEVCLDTEQCVWVMLHSGSRGPGNVIGSYFIEKAKREIERWYINLPDKDLAYLSEGSEYFQDYIDAVSWAQDYAKINRELMMHHTLAALEVELGMTPTIVGEAINCHHNYISKEHHFNRNVWITRKGAVRARQGDLGIIPGSMGSRSYIVRGKGNQESFTSCSHGAGRSMSRTEARKRFTVEDHIKATEGVECRKDASVIDETVAAYKPIEAVMAAQHDLVDIVTELKQVLCVKG